MGLTINPKNSNQIATGGGDQTLRIWDIYKNKQITCKMLTEDFRAIDWSSDGKFIIIGTTNGFIYYFDLESQNLKKYKSIFYSDKINQKEGIYESWIQELKISPDATMVAYGSHCAKGKSFGKIEILAIQDNKREPLKQKCIVDCKITSALTHLDWGIDNDSIVVNSLAYELKHISVLTQSVMSSSDCVYEKDIKWNTWTCIFGYPVKGVWPPEATGYIVNYTCRSHNQKIIATGDDFGYIKLFSCPCIADQAGYKSYGGHSSHITKIRFTPNDQYLISVGGNDKCVFVWETDI